MTLSTKDGEVVTHVFTQVEAMTGYSRGQLGGRARDASIVSARWLAMSAIRRATSLGLKSIGELFNRDHATVLHALARRKGANFQEMEDDVLLGVVPRQEYTPDPSVEEATKLLLDAQESINKAVAILAEIKQ